MFSKILALSAFVAAASAGVINTYAAAPAYGYAAPVTHATYAAPTLAHAAYAAPAYGYAAAPAIAKTVEFDAHPQYSYAYSVSDALTGDNKEQHETRDGDVVRGSYSLIESDGTRRTVEYTADDVNGFNAVVHKEPAVHQKTIVAAPAYAKVASPLAYAAPVAHAAYAAPAYGYGAPAYAAPAYGRAILGSAVVLLVALAGVAQAGVLAPAYSYAAPVVAHAPVAYAAPAYAAPAYAAPAYAKVATPVVAAAKVAPNDFDAHPQYSFSYSVADAVTGDNKEQHESRDGDVVQGSYSLVEPDGSKRTVEYTADPVNGFNAVVNKEPAAAKAYVATPVVAKVATPVLAKVATPVAYHAPLAYHAPVVAHAPFAYHAPYVSHGPVVAHY
ncbi:cuticle protein 19.8-like [Neocloeon triangulifer]|uniref:cuticle protein 19.8-like n=1 Tax=Neocloeon triangulifer TaxID=2078957 RepID=UPI00286F17B4|nr:cuticle protein 19.8-like [Neocloeon triangulifer]